MSQELIHALFAPPFDKNRDAVDRILEKQVLFSKPASVLWKQRLTFLGAFTITLSESERSTKLGDYCISAVAASLSRSSL